MLAKFLSITLVKKELRMILALLMGENFRSFLCYRLSGDS